MITNITNFIKDTHVENCINIIHECSEGRMHSLVPKHIIPNTAENRFLVSIAAQIKINAVKNPPITKKVSNKFLNLFRWKK